MGLSASTIKEAWIARGLLALIVGLSVLIVYMAKLFNDWNARFYNALQDKNAEAFWAELSYWVGAGGAVHHRRRLSPLADSSC